MPCASEVAPVRCRGWRVGPLVADTQKIADSYVLARPRAGAVPGRKGAHLQEAAAEELTAAEGPPAGEPLAAHIAACALVRPHRPRVTLERLFGMRQELTSLRILDIIGIEERPQRMTVAQGGSRQQQEAA